MELFILGLFSGAFVMWAVMRERAASGTVSKPSGDDLLTVTLAFEKRLTNVEKIMDRANAYPRRG